MCDKSATNIYKIQQNVIMVVYSYKNIMKRGSKMYENKSIHILKRGISILLVLAMVLPLVILFVYALTDEERYKASLAEKGFPQSYHETLWQMHKVYPNWEFEALVTNLEWNDVVANEALDGKCTVNLEMTTRLLLSKSYGTYNSNGTFTYKVFDGNQANQTGHINSTPLAVSFFMDPRNFIGDPRTIFQFEKLSYDSSVHTLAGIEQIVANSFMNNTVSYTNTSGAVVSTGERYAQVILEAGQTHNVNPYYLASKIIQEVGNKGSGSVSGKESGYIGYYNFYNIGAYASTTGGAVENGLNHAKSKGWDTPRKSIVGGAQFIAGSYIAVGQNTPYLQKFNVVKSPFYQHQYMSAVHDPAQSAYSTYSGYNKLNTLNASHKFLIPIYKNMPDRTASNVFLNNAVRTGKCNTQPVNVRTGPSIDAPVAKTVGNQNLSLSKGTSVEILGGYRSGDLYPMYRGQLWYPFWYNIRFTGPDGKVYTGYVYENYIDTDANITITKGASRTLGYTLQPAGSTDKPMFMSVDSRIAQINADGQVVAKSTGTTTIVAFLSGGAFDVIKVNVVEGGQNPPPSGGGEDSPTTITSPNYEVTSTGYIKGLTENTTLATLKNRINNNSYIKIFDSAGKEITDSNARIGTGAVVKLISNGVVVDTKTVVVRGDVNGDGLVNVTDMLNVKAYILRTRDFSGPYAQAANYKNDPKGTINITDFIQIKSYILNK